jgi:LacI family transcriptional regulator
MRPVPSRRRAAGSRPPVAKIGDVARAAGVSSATVSRVLNGTSTVSPARAERVLQAVAELGYQPFGPARALRQQLTRVWAAIVADIENPFFTAMVRGIEDEARDRGHRLVLCNSDEHLDREAAYIDVAIAERMAGVVISAASTSESTFEALLERGIPVVAVDRIPERHRHDIDSVVVDNELGARLATTHLVEAGARRIACITGPTRVSTAGERLAGYRSALADAGLPADAALVKRADFKEPGGYQATQALLAAPGSAGSPGDRPDALFVANNLMTLGALHAVHEAGLRVPEDVAIVGFDDAPWTPFTSPALTVVAQPTYEIGLRAAELLATAGDSEGSRHVVLDPTLVVRRSSVSREPTS